MRNGGLVSISKLSMFSLVGVVLGIATLIVVMTAVVGSRSANATAAFAGQTGKACGYCHVNPSGSGKLTGQGQRFKSRGNKM